MFSTFCSLTSLGNAFEFQDFSPVELKFQKFMKSKSTKSDEEIIKAINAEPLNKIVPGSALAQLDKNYYNVSFGDPCTSGNQCKTGLCATSCSAMDWHPSHSTVCWLLVRHIYKVQFMYVVLAHMAGVCLPVHQWSWPRWMHAHGMYQHQRAKLWQLLMEQNFRIVLQKLHKWSKIYILWWRSRVLKLLLRLHQ